jgi:MFS family permease
LELRPLSSSAFRHPLFAAFAGYRLALAQPAYRRLWLAAVMSRTGDTINFAALPLFVFGLTRTPSAVAALVFTEGIGLIAGGIVAQLVVDRLPPRQLLVIVDLLRAVAAGLLTLVPAFPTAIAVSFVLAAGTASFSPVSNAVIPRLIPDRALPAANGLQWTAGVGLQLVAAPLGGLLVTIGLVRLAFGLNALSFAGSAVLLLGLPDLSPLQKKSRAIWLQLAGTLQAVRQVRFLRSLLAMQSLAALAVGATSALLVVLARQAYGLSGTGYGLWLSAIAVGALIGPLLLPALQRLPPSRTVPIAYIIRGLGDMGLGVLRNGLGGGLLLALYGVNTSSGTVAFQTMVQRDVPPELRGRAFALLDVAWQTSRLVSIAIGAGLVSIIGIRWLFVIGGVLLVVAGTVGTLGLGASDQKLAQD